VVARAQDPVAVQYSGRTDSCLRRIPDRLSRRCSTYIESAAPSAAIRSGTSRSARQAVHHTAMSASLGGCFAVSIRLVLAGFQPAAADSAGRPARRHGGCRAAARQAAAGRAGRWTTGTRARQASR